MTGEVSTLRQAAYVGSAPKASDERTICWCWNFLRLLGRFGPEPHGAEVERTITGILKDLTNRWSQPLAAPMTNSQHFYEVRPRNDHRGVDLISNALPFGRLWYGEPNAISNAIDYASFSAARMML